MTTSSFQKNLNNLNKTKNQMSKRISAENYNYDIEQVTRIFQFTFNLPAS